MNIEGASRGCYILQFARRFSFFTHGYHEKERTLYETNDGIDGAIMRI